MIGLRIIVPLLALGTLTAPAALAQGKKPKKERPHAERPAEPAAGERAAGVRVVTDAEIKIIRDYYQTRGAKPKALPPGIAKNLARGKPLPPGIAKTRFPAELVGRLPPRPNYQWVVTGDVVVLIDPVGVVVDILRQVF